MKLLIIESQRTQELKDILTRNTIKKLNDCTLKEEQLAVVIDEVYKLGRASVKR